MKSVLIEANMANTVIKHNIFTFSRCIWMRTILITIVVRDTLMYKIIKGFFLVFILGLQHELVQESHSEEEESHELFFWQKAN